MIEAMRCALLLLCLLACAGCPRQTNETVPVARKAPPPPSAVSPISAKPQDGASSQSAAEQAKPKTEIKAVMLTGPEIKPPIDYLELGTGFKPAELPAAVTADFPGAKVSSGKDELGVTTGGETVWLQGFTTKANDAEIGNYYSGLLGVKGFQKYELKEDASKGGKARKRKALRAWRSADKRFEIQVYDTGQVATPAGDTLSRPIYVVEIHDRPASANGGTGP